MDQESTAGMVTRLPNSCLQQEAIRLVAMLRVSTEEQAKDDRSGLPRQEEVVLSIAQRLGVPESRLLIVPVIDVSGSDLSQTLEWKTKILPELERPDTHLAIDDVLRILRPDNYDFTVAQEILRTQSMVYTWHGEIDPSTEHGFMMLTLGGLMGGTEKLRFKRIVFGGKETKRKRG